MRQRTVIGNWKMHGSVSTVRSLVTEIIEGLPDSSIDSRVAVCPSFIHLELVRQILKNSGSNIELGAQDARAEDEGAFTGDVSASMLKDFGASCVLVGHSERRLGLGESDELVALKFGAIKGEGLTPILCVGESQSQRDQGKTEETVLSQVRAITNKFGISAFERAIIAYEPIWAIGTGVTATPEQVQAVHELIRAFLAMENSLTADSVRIIYGGSVNSKNAASLFTQRDIDGGLVGGASLKAEEFISICKS
mgnify:FL=1